MTETEWLACSDPKPMLKILNEKASDRRLRLFAVACCCWVAQLEAVPTLLDALGVAERYADGAATTDDLEGAERVANEVYWEADDSLNEAACRSVLANVTEQGDDPGLVALYDAADSVSAATAIPVRATDAADTAARKSRSGTNQHTPAALLRDIFSNPFRPAAFDPAWRAPTVTSLASQMYDSRDFGAMPILADALQDAGCDCDDLLNHCRGDGPHVRGCWVVDLVLGKA